jgi:hypothetical protein
VVHNCNRKAWPRQIQKRHDLVHREFDPEDRREEEEGGGAQMCNQMYEDLVHRYAGLVYGRMHRNFTLLVHA